MRVVLLGTGSADGWPNPWCTCASCEWMRSNGEIRGQTSALVDGVLLIDCGPEAPRAALRHGHSLAGVRHVLFTHAHPDHFGPAALMWRGWTSRAEPIDVAGPPAVIAESRRWVAPADAPIAWHELRAGDQVRLGGYDVRALAASHGHDDIGPALLYDITDARGHRLLWATDTRAVPAETAGRGYDVVLLEETNGEKYDAGTDHLDLGSWPLAVAELRRSGAVTTKTQVLPIHMSDANPPPPQLRVLMAQWGARVPDDGDVIETTGDMPTERRVPRRVLVIGGARSGKSRYAESLLLSEPEVTYVATSFPRPGDVEWQHRVEQHRKRRPAHWRTVETLDVAAAIESATLVECVTLWLAALLDDEDLPAQCDRLVEAVAAGSGHVVLVSNEVGEGVVPPSESGRRFRDELGTLNARLAAVCDEVWKLTAGIPVRLK